VTKSEAKASILRSVAQLNTWRQRDVRAPHKPLLFLMGISRILRREPRLVSFASIEDALARLLRLYGPRRSQVHPEYPFWWLQSDGLWEVTNPQALSTRRSNSNPTRSSLRALGFGGFPVMIDTAFRQDSRLVQQTVSLVLNSHFPDSLHEGILNELNMACDILCISQHRDADFRRAVVDAYEHRCAMCGFDAKLDGTDVALEAAHVRWRQADGPDIVQNGVALCSIHHQAFDLGAITLEADMRIKISGAIHGSGAMNRWFTAFHRKPLRLPHSKSLHLLPAFVAWHEREVFRQPPRD
jgi:putative restriction endonuclease